MRLNDLSPNPGSKHRRKRVGNGESSGLGKTCGRGHKGQKSRSGGGVRLGFEGGQMPIYRRLPKKGFNNIRFATRYAVVNVGTLNERFEDGAAVDEAALRDAGLVQGRWDGIKILGSGELTKKLTITADRISESARGKIEKAGGTCSAPAEQSAPVEEPKTKKKADAPAEAAAPVAETKPEAPAADDSAESEA